MGVESAKWGAVSSVAAYGIGSAAQSYKLSSTTKALLHGVSRAGVSHAQGSTYSAGFWSGFAASALAPQNFEIQNNSAKITMSAIVGGTVSVLGGGKFANGAVSGAFVQMFNDLLHETSPLQKIANKYPGHCTNDGYFLDNGTQVTQDGFILANPQFSSRPGDQLILNGLMLVGGGGLVGAGVRVGYRGYLAVNAYLMRNPNQFVTAYNFVDGAFKAGPTNITQTVGHMTKQGIFRIMYQ